MRAPNDLAYIAAACKHRGWDVFCRDYQTENATTKDVTADLKNFNPTAIFLSTTNTTIHDDLGFLRQLKTLTSDAIILVKGAIFFDPPPDLLAELNLDEIDYLIGGECEFITDRIIDAHYHNDRLNRLADIPGMLYRNPDKQWQKTAFNQWCDDLDALPIPDRSAINNVLYTRPDTSAPMATIIAARGCPSACIFCQTPIISGRSLRVRSPENILEELRDCYHQHGIREFFFRADTFTFDADWVMRVCKIINESELAGKISWAANSRVRPLELKTLQAMKHAGFWLVAFGFESGDPESLKRMKKGVSVENNHRAVRLARQAGLKTFGFYLIGFPWETKEHLHSTRKLMFQNNCDFVELHLAVPFYGTPLYDLAGSAGLLDGQSTVGKDYFSAPSIGTKYLTREELQRFHKRTLLRYHLGLRFIFRKLTSAISQPKVLCNYARFGWRLIKNCLK